MKNKRIISIILMLVMVFSNISFTQAVDTSNVTADSDLQLYYQFQDDVTSGVIKDASGNNNDGVLNGTGATIANGVLTLPGVV